MGKRLLKLYGISNSQSQSGAFALILTDVKTDQRIPIIIGAFEAQSIALHLEGMKPSRPLTHDLFANFANEFNIIVHEVIISDFKEGVFYARIICEQEGVIRNIDSRTSDAVALALRFDCPIYASDEVVEQTAISLDDDLEPEEEPESDEVFGVQAPQEDDLSNYTVEELENMLDAAVAKEDFEFASKVRDEINKRT
jgi:bifunctional DNase/RNase